MHLCVPVPFILDILPFKNIIFWLFDGLPPITILKTSAVPASSKETSKPLKSIVNDSKL
jgi:hypothetical protein